MSEGPAARLVLGMSSHEYHAETDHESSSNIKLFIQDPEKYWHVRVARDWPADAVGHDAEIGSATHALLFEPGAFSSQVAVADRGVTHLQKAFREFKASLAAGAIALTTDDLDRVEGMIEGIRANREAVRLLDEAGYSEASLFFTDPETRLPLKCRFDRVTHGGAILDLKCVRDPYPDTFSRDIGERLYDVSAAMYVRGLSVYRKSLDQLPNGEEALPFYFLAVRNVRPHTCIVYRLTRDALEAGRAELDGALREIARLRDECGELVTWQSPLVGQVNLIDLPRWRYSRLEQLEVP